MLVILRRPPPERHAGLLNSLPIPYFTRHVSTASPHQVSQGQVSQGVRYLTPNDKTHPTLPARPFPLRDRRCVGQATIARATFQPNGHSSGPSTELSRHRRSRRRLPFRR